MAASDYIYYRLDSDFDLVSFPANDICELDWHADLAMIQRFYRHWTDDEILPPDESESECGNPIALVRNGEILSFAIPFSFKDGETEIGAVATLPDEQNKGLCRRVISEVARRILAFGKSATLTTRPDNLAIQTAAEAIGFRHVMPSKEKQQKS